LGSEVSLLHEANAMLALPEIRHRRGGLPAIAAVDEHTRAGRCRADDHASAEGHDGRAIFGQKPSFVVRLWLWRGPIDDGAFDKRASRGGRRSARRPGGRLTGADSIANPDGVTDSEPDGDTDQAGEANRPHARRAAAWRRDRRRRERRR